MGTLKGMPHPVGTAVATGGAAGPIKVDGDIEPGDSLICVYEFSDDLATKNDLTTAFTISDAGEIDNTTGSTTAGNNLLVAWQKAE